MKKMLGIETARMGRIGQRPFQIEGRAVSLLGHNEQGRLGLCMSLGHEDLVDGEFLFLNKSAWFVILFLEYKTDTATSKYIWG